MRFTFTKNERLCSLKLIEALTVKGNPSFLLFPYIFVWKEATLPVKVEVQVLISVSKRKFPHAVDRNRIKRLTREAYRLNKHILYKALGSRQLTLHINYIGKEILPYEKVEASMIKGIDKLIQEMNHVQVVIN